MDLDFWRKVGELHEGGFVPGVEGAVLFGFGFQGYPFGVYFELCPGFGGGFAALVAQDVGEGVAGERFVGGGPEAYEVHAEAGEDLRLFGAHAVEDEREFAGVEVVDAELVDGGGGDLLRGGGGVERGGDEGGGSEGLEEIAAVHLGSRCEGRVGSE